MNREEFLALVEDHKADIRVFCKTGNNLYLRLASWVDGTQATWWDASPTVVWETKYVGSHKRRLIFNCMVQVLGLDPQTAPEGSWFRTGPLLFKESVVRPRWAYTPRHVLNTQKGS